MRATNENMFRKVALERLSTPDQLDQTLRVVSSKSWAGLAAMVLLIAAAAAWAWKGTLSTRVAGQAVIVRTGGMLNVSAQGTGQIVVLAVNAGDRVERGQVLARIAQPSLVERIRAARDAVSEARGESTRAVSVRRESSKLQIAAIERQRANLTREIGELEEQAKLAAEQIPVEEQLLAKGLNTKQQVIEARQKLISIQAEVARHRAQLTQLDAQRYQSETEPAQVQADSHSRVAELERRLAELNQEMSFAANVTSPQSGEVIEVKVQPGSAVAAGTPLFTIQPTGNDLEVLVYVPAERAKEIQPGMKARVSPTTVKREEFGYMQATVSAVAEFPATQAALMRNFQNENLVKSLERDGPVTEMRVQLERDAATPTGFRWSSSKGPRASITAGTLATAEVTTRQQSPMTLILPILRKKMGL